IGNLSFSGAVKGHGLKLNTLVADIDGTIREIGYNNYVYKNIIAKGKLNKQLFDGAFSIDDPNAVMKLNGVIDFNSNTPKFNFIADVQKANLRELHLSKENLSFTGKFNLNFTGNNIDNFLGSARITEASLLKDSTRLSFDSLILTSSYANGVKNLRAVSNEFDASITGEFNIDELPSAFTLFLNKYYPAYIREPRRLPKKEAFTFDITTGNVDEYIKLFDKNLGGFNNSHITGNLNLANNVFKLDADVPQFSFKKYVFNNARIKSDGNFERLLLTGDLDNIIIADSLNLPQTSFQVESKNDISAITITTSSNQAINKATIAAQVQTYSDGVKIRFQPSTFVLNGKTWTIQENGELQLRRRSMSSGEVVLTESNQEVRINSVPSEEGNWSDLKVVLKSLNIGDFSPFLLKKNRLEGMLSGNILVENPGPNMRIISDLKTDQLRMDNDSIGEVQANILYNNKTGQITGKGNNLDPEHKINFDLNLFLNDSLQNNNRISTTFTSFQLKILERFLGTLFSEIEGFVTGNLNITGPFNKMNFVGKGRLQDAGLKVNFTQCFYKIDDADIELKPNELDLGTLKLHDRYGKTATLTGNLKHTSWKNMEFDISAHVDGQPFELLNTSLKNNKIFYGTAKGTGSLALIGPQSDLFMKIDAIASDVDSSFITIRSTETRETGVTDFLVERKYGREMTTTDIKTNATSITYDVDLTANPHVNVKFILDDLTGDEINGKGEGNLNIRSGTFEPLTMRGRFDIQEGDYTFTFQSFFKKPFTLRPGGANYISWSGDPLAAKVRLEAQYT
ncbi:MAG: translocation/assembly module TamB, partial [Bacteroidota bacterium]|nr:translocation/assembly module TamB [Bacteroidota bacterium]